MRRLRGSNSQAAIAGATAILICGQVAGATPSDVFNYSAPAPQSSAGTVRELSTGEYAVASQTGAFTYTFPIVAPPGRHLQPSLALHYSSDGPVRGGIASGWSVPIAEISLDTSGSNLALQDESVERVWVSSMAGGQRLISEAEGSSYYRAQHDTSYTRYRKMPSGAWPWEARSAAGLFYTFGERAMVDGGLPSAAVDPTRAPLTRTVDPYGNTIRYYWRTVVSNKWVIDNTFDHPQSAAVDLVLDRVEYTSNDTPGAELAPHARVQFSYDEDPAVCGDPSMSVTPPGAKLTYRSGQRKVHGAWPLAKIETQVRQTQSGPFQPVRRITLQYDEDARRCDAPHGPRRLLQAITESYATAGGWADLPAHTFSYGPLSPSFNRYASVFPRNEVWGAGIASGTRADDTRWTTVDARYTDLDGDGGLERIFVREVGGVCKLYMEKPGFAAVPVVDLPMLPWRTGAGPQGAERCSLSGQFTTYENVDLLSGWEDPTLCADTSYDLSRPRGSYSAYRFMDYNGDGLLDLLNSYEADPFFLDPNLIDPYDEACTEDDTPTCLELDRDCMGQDGDPVPCHEAESCVPFAADPDRYELCAPQGTPVDCPALFSGCLGCPTEPGAPPHATWFCFVDRRQAQRACNGYVIRIYTNLGVSADGTPQFSGPREVLWPTKLEAESGESATSGGKFGFFASRYGLVDIDGDGFVDSIGPGDQDDQFRLWQAFRGDVDGWMTGKPSVLNYDGRSHEIAYGFRAPDGLELSRGYNRPNPGDSADVGSDQTLLDVNGDGLVDIVSTVNVVSLADGRVLVGDRHQTEVFYNNGAGAWGRWLDELAGDEQGRTGIRLDHEDDVTRSAVTAYDASDRAVDRVDEIRMLDFDGDGLVDRLSLDGDPSYYRVSFGTGDQFLPPVTIGASRYFKRPLSADGGEFFSWDLMHESANRWSVSSDLVDFDGDGLIDMVDSSPNQISVNFGMVQRGHPPGLLYQVNNGRGAVTAVTYASSRDKTVVTAGTMPRAKWVVRSMEATPSKDASPSVTEYSYAYPEFNNRGPDQRWGFRGFETVTVVGPRGSAVQSRYSYEKDWSGRLEQATTYRSADLTGVHSVRTMEWAPYSLFGGRIETFHKTITRDWACRDSDDDVAACMRRPSLYTENTWSAVPGASGYIGLQAVVVGEGPSLLPGHRRTRAGAVGGWEVYESASDYFVTQKTTESHEWDGSTWVATGWQQRVFDGTYHSVEEVHTRLDASGRVAVSKTDYDYTTGNVTKTIDPKYAGAAGPGTTYTYRDEHKLLDVRVADAGGNVEYRYFDFATGAMIRQLGPEYNRVWVPCGVIMCPSYQWNEQTWAVDRLGRTTGHWVTSPNDEQTSVQVGWYAYFDGEPSTARIQEATNTYGAIGTTTDLVFDGVGAIVESSVALDSALTTWATTTFEYEHGSLRKVSAPDPSDDVGTVTYETRYDSLGRAEFVIAPDGTGTRTSYDGRSTVVADGKVVGDVMGPTTDHSGTETATIHDVFGRLVEVGERDTVACAGGVLQDADLGTGWCKTSYEYDANDNLARVIDGDDVVTEMHHNYAGWREVIVRDADGATEREWEYQYDLNGNMTAKISPRPAGATEADYTTRYDYDALNRLRTKVPGRRNLSSYHLTYFYGGSGESDRTTTYLYDDGAHDARGRLYKVQLPHGEIEYQYDWRGAVTDETRRIDIRSPWGRNVTGEFTRSHTLNAMSAPTYTVYPDGLRTYHSYDQRRNTRQAWLEKTAGVWKLLAQDTRNKAGLVTRRDATGVNQHRQIRYDQLGRPVSDYVYYNGSATRAYYNPRYNQAGQVDRLRSFYGYTDFVYDPRGQLARATGPYDYSATLSYHRNGNIKAADITWDPGSTDRGLPAAFERDVIYEYGAADPQAVDHLVASDTGADVMSYAYDLSGNMVRRTDVQQFDDDRDHSLSVVYDGDDRARWAYDASYQHEFYYYDHDGQRMLRFEDGGAKLRLYFGDYEAVLDTGSNSELACERRKYLYAGGQPVAELKGVPVCDGYEGLRVNYHAGRGDLLVSLDESGKIAGRYQYGAFGEITHTYSQANSFSGSSYYRVEDIARTFNNQEYDWHSDWYYYGFRYFDTFSLTWNRADPLYRLVPDLAGATPRRMNLYTFSLNNPVRYRDLDGLDATPSRDQPGGMGMGKSCDGLGRCQIVVYADESGPPPDPDGTGKPVVDPAGATDAAVSWFWDVASGLVAAGTSDGKEGPPPPAEQVAQIHDTSEKSRQYAAKATSTPERAAAAWDFWSRKLVLELVATVATGSVARLRGNPLDGTTYTGKVRQQMRRGLGPPDNHGFPLVVDNFAGYGKRTTIKGGDGVIRTKVELRGAYKGKSGTFEWIIEPDKTVNHRLFVPDL